MLGHEDRALFLSTVSYLVEAELRHDISNNDCGWSYSVSVGLKHTFHGDFSEAEKGKQLTGASRMSPEVVLGLSILDMLGTIM